MYFHFHSTYIVGVCKFFATTVHAYFLTGGESGWCNIKHASTTNTIKDYQMWKIVGNSLVSEYNNAVLAIQGDNVLSVNIRDGEVTEAVSIDDSTTSSSSFPIAG